MNDSKDVVIGIIDCDPQFWASVAKSKKDSDIPVLGDAVSQILSYFNSIKLSGLQNSIQIYCVHPGASELVWPLDGDEKTEHKGALEESTRRNSIIWTRIKQSLTKSVKSAKSRESLVCGAISSSLCYCAKVQKQEMHFPNCRIILFTPGKEMKRDQENFMNCTFFAEKKKIKLDFCCFGPDNKSFQEASKLSKGTYVSMTGLSSNLLLPALMFHFG